MDGDALAVRVVSSVDMGGCEERAQPLAVDGTCSLFFPVSNFSWRLLFTVSLLKAAELLSSVLVVVIFVEG